MIKVVVCAIAVVALAGCPGPMSVRYPSDPAEPTGTVILAFSKPASGVVVAVNGHMVVDGDDASKIVIDGIPTGTAELSIAAGPTEKQLSVWVSEDNAVTIPMGSAGGSASDTIKGLLSSIAGILVYALLFR